MVAAIRRVSRPLLACVLAFAALMASAGPAAASKAQYEKAYALGLEAYTYGLPLLETNKTFLTMTSINVSNNGFGPVNQFNSVRNANRPTSKAVVAPGSNGLSSIAWLDLTAGPEVLHVPVTPVTRLCSRLLDPYTEDSGTWATSPTPPGYYVIAGPGQHTSRSRRGPTDRRRLHADLDHRLHAGEGQERPPHRAPHSGRLHTDAALAFGHDDHPQPPAHPITRSRPTASERATIFDVWGSSQGVPAAGRQRVELRMLARSGSGRGWIPRRTRV